MENFPDDKYDVFEFIYQRLYRFSENKIKRIVKSSLFINALGFLLLLLGTIRSYLLLIFRQQIFWKGHDASNGADFLNFTLVLQLLDAHSAERLAHCEELRLLRPKQHFLDFHQIYHRIRHTHFEFAINFFLNSILNTWFLVIKQSLKRISDELRKVSREILSLIKSKRFLRFSIIFVITSKQCSAEKILSKLLSTQKEELCIL